MASNKKSYFAMSCRVFHAYTCNDILSESYYLLTPSAWLHSYRIYGSYILTDYSLVLFRSLPWYRSGLIILARK